MKFYLTKNATITKAGVRFQTVSVQASAIGIYKTDDEAVIERLDAAVKDPRSAVEEITEEEYDRRLAGKKPEPIYMRHVSPTGTILTAAPAPQKVISVSGEPTLNEQAVEVSAVRRTGRAARRAASAGGSNAVV